MVKKEKAVYICLSQKDRDDLKKWNKSDPKKTKSISKKQQWQKCLDNMADKLKGKSYHVFLKSRYWQIVRKRVLDRDGKQCVICKSDSSLEVHHDNYKYHFREHRHLKSLMTLCKNCHKQHHYAQM